MPTASHTQEELNAALADAKNVFILRLIVALCWPISATIMWMTYAMYPSPVLAAAIAFTGVAIMYLFRAMNGYFAYMNARDEAGLNPK